MSCYLSTLIFLYNFNSFFLFWVLMELNMIFFLGILTLESFSFKNIFCQGPQILYYFLIQSFCSVIFILLSMFIEYNGIFYVEFSIFMFLMIKMGIFPFHSWVYKISTFLPYFSFLIFLVLQKIPLLFFFYTYFSSFIVYTLIFNMIVGSFFLLKSHYLVGLLVSSSIYNIFWMVLMLFSSLSLFLYYIFFYLFHSLFLVFKSNLKDTYYETKDMAILVASSLFFMGLPPFGLFYTKFYMVGMVFLSFSSILLFLILVSVVVSLVGYFKFFSNLFYNFNPLYTSSGISVYLFYLVFVFLFFLI